MTMRSPEDKAAADSSLQQDVLGFLDGSQLGPAAGGKRVDTHASIVFLGADRALKLKRSVRLPFLDYSTLEKRRLACEEELNVNAANAPELYRRVVAITRSPDGAFEIDGKGAPVEWAVEMARFDESRSLDRLAASGPIEPALASAVADAILRSHHNASPADGETWLTSILPIIERNTAKFRSIRRLEAAAIDRLEAASRNTLKEVRPLLAQRGEQGFVRRCHGDLHLANIALVDGRPLLFDAIEFDPVIATTDILYDLAFTLMDLIHFGQEAAANVAFNRYLAGEGDRAIEGLPLLPLFMSMRAAIRAHVLFVKSEQGGADDGATQEAQRYFDLAQRLISPEKPLVVAIGGLSGTGKSVLARGLAGFVGSPPGAVIVRSDVVRKRLFDTQETTALPQSAYQSGTADTVYDALSRAAGLIMERGCSVVLDATYQREADRGRLDALAAEHGWHFVGLFLTADLPTRLARVEQRRNDASDATSEVALKQETFATGTVKWPMIDASGTPEDTLRKALTLLPTVPGQP